jgi:carbamoyl-phosphate synthase small subunit
VPAFSVQYHPEAGPGPHDAKYLFGMFDEIMGGDGVRRPSVSGQLIQQELGVG